MKRIALLCLILPLAGCFAWDMDEKPLPWYPDPGPEKPAIGTVVWYGDKQPVPAPQPATYVTHATPAEVPPAPILRETIEVEVEEEVLPAAPAAAPAEQAAPSASDARLAALESRIEELYQLLLKSYEKKEGK